MKTNFSALSRLSIVSLCLIIMSLSVSISAQKLRIEGKVTEKEGNSLHPFSNASVTLLKSDSTWVGGTTTDNAGSFSLYAENKGNYILKVSFIGYESSIINLLNLEKNIKLDNIEMNIQSTELKEVQITGNNLIRKIDRMIVLPTQAALANSYNPYDLINNLAIPHLRVDPISKSMEANGGGVQTRINGIVASTAEVAAVLPKDIVRIEMIENPGERYGDSSLGAVVDIIVRQRETGGIVNIQTMNSPHVLFGDNSVSTKFNHKKSQWGLFYSMTDRGMYKTRTDAEETFNLATEKIHRIQEGIDDKTKHFIHNIDLSYNLSEPGKYAFNVVFRNNIFEQPFNNSSNKLYDASSKYDYILSKINNNSSSYSPSLDIYFQRTLPKGQSLVLNVAGTLINTDSHRDYSEFKQNNQPLAFIETDINGKKRSIIGEAIYDKTFKNLVLTAGLRHYQMHAENIYTGTASAVSDMDQMKSSGFVEIKGNLKKLSYGVSVGLSRTYFKEQDISHTFYSFTPTLRLGFVPHKNAYLNYRFNTEPNFPSLSSLTNVEQAIDTIQIKRGNPNLKTYNVYNNTLSYSYVKDFFIGMLNASYSYRDNCIMDSVFVEGNKIISKDENQKSYQSLTVGPTIIIKALTIGKLKNFLTLSLDGGFARYWSSGNNYTHIFNNFYYNAQFMLNYKKFAFVGQFTKRPNALWGETINKGENITALMATYTHRSLQVGVAMFFPFTNNYKTGKERISDVAPYTSWSYAKEIGQMFAVKLCYNFEFGKKYNETRKRINNTDNDAGLLKMER